MAEKMTQKEMFAHIMEVCEEFPEIVEFCEHKLAQLEKSRGAGKSKKVSPETEAFRAAIATLLSEAEEPMTNKAITEAMGVASQKIAGNLREMVKAGKVIRIEPEKKGGSATFMLAGAAEPEETFEF